MDPSEAYRVLGIDPGLHITGYGAVDFAGLEPRLVEAGTIRTGAKAEMPERLGQLYTDLTELLAELKPHTVAIEKLYAHYKHPRTSILMGHARGVLMLACHQAGIGVRNLPATQVKKGLTGNGHAGKAQVQAAIQSICRLDAPPQPPDVADALAIALVAGRHMALS
jgi:crossover junction endodeoxyribonuclease RuvC